MNMRNKRTGYTLVEVMVVVALLGLVISISIGMLFTSLQGQRASYAEYDIQSNLRIASMRLTNVINESTAVFSITEDDFVFDEAVPTNSTLTAEWHYYGILTENDDNNKVLKDKYGNLVGSKLVKYEWVPQSGATEGHHKMVVLADSGENAKFSLEFTQPYNEETGEAYGQKFIGFTISLVSSDDIKGEPLYSLSSQLEAKNANQVVFRSTDYQKAVAIAVRSIANIDLEEQKQEHVTFVHMVFDVSGSMDAAVDGTVTSNSNNKRITKLKDAAGNIIDNFAKSPGVEIVIYPFSTSANYEKSGFTSHPIYRNTSGAASEFGGVPILAFSDAKTAINDLKAKGGTNVADAFRRVYHKIDFINKKYKPKYYPNATLHHYVIFLMDGQPTMICMAQDNSAKNPEERNCYFYKDGENYTVSTYNNDFSSYYDAFFGRYLYRRPQGESSGQYQLWYGDGNPGIKNSFAQRRAMEIYPELLDDSKLNKQLFDDAKKDPLGVEKLYFIGFSTKKVNGVAVDTLLLETIAKNSGLRENANGGYENGGVFDFSKLGDNADLYKIFESIAEDVLRSKWIIEGPGH